MRTPTKVALAGFIAAAVLVSGCGIRQVVGSSIAHGKAAVVIGGKTLALGDEVEMQNSYQAHFGGEVLDGKTIPCVRHLAIGVHDTSRDCSAAVKFFRDSMSAGTPVESGGSDWQGVKVAHGCAGEWRAGAFSQPPPDEPTIPGGYRAQTVTGTYTPYSDTHGFDGFFAIAGGF
jgi:hypothetical protein